MTATGTIRSEVQHEVAGSITPAGAFAGNDLDYDDPTARPAGYSGDYLCHHQFCGAGCEIPDGTPYENLYAQAQTLQAIGKL